MSSWQESYRSLLDHWQCWHERAKFDIAKSWLFAQVAPAALAKPKAQVSGDDVLVYSARTSCASLSTLRM